MQQAAEINDTAMVWEVDIDEGSLVYVLNKTIPGGSKEFFRLTKSGATKVSFNTQSGAKQLPTSSEQAVLLVPQWMNFDENASLPNWASEVTQDSIVKTLSGLVSNDIGETVGIISIFVWMSFMHPYFDELPVLWLYSPNNTLRQTLKDVLRQMCFNGLEAKSYYMLSSVLFDCPLK